MDGVIFEQPIPELEMLMMMLLPSNFCCQEHFVAKKFCCQEILLPRNLCCQARVRQQSDHHSDANVSHSQPGLACILGVFHIDIYENIFLWDRALDKLLYSFS